MEAKVTNILDVLNKKKRAPLGWLPIYTNSVAFVGFAIVMFALIYFPKDWFGLILFALIAAFAELSDVELFKSSRSRVSVSSIIAIASILVFGPMTGVLTHMVSGIMTAVTTSLRSQQSEKGRVSWLPRAAFNTGMFVISAAIAGWVYVLIGGTSDDIAQTTNIFPLLGAVIAYVVVNLAILIGVIAVQTGRHPLHIWKQDFQWAVPIAVLGSFIGGGVLALAYDMFQILGLIVFFFPILSITYSFRLYVDKMKIYVEKLEKANSDLDQANLELLETLGAVIDAYDIYTYGHSTQVTVYADAIAEQMKLSDEERSLVIKAAMVHDVGKVGVMEAIMGKQEKLTDEEYELIKRHTIIGAEILSQMKGLEDIVPLVKHHHERWDGRGYPDGLKGEEIPLGARILTLADSLDAMLSDRPYRSTRSFQEVMAEVGRCSGTQFDPDVVAAFISVTKVKDRYFFKNSATTVDNVLQMNEVTGVSREARYLKKSMIPDTIR
jgi:putative nucleotidyltransferase with HDIG domain